MTEVPKQELLLKLLKMTTSDNDGECLTAIRKANAALSAAGWDWDALIHSKIKIVEDPFKNLGVPINPNGGARPSGGAYTPYTAPPRPTPKQPPPPPKPQTWPLGIQPNRFAGFCYCCGNEVMANTGVIFKPYQYNSTASDDWKVACLACNGTNTRPGAQVFDCAASRKRSYNSKGRAKPHVSDLS